MNWNAFTAITRQGSSFTGGYVAGLATLLMLSPEKIIAASQAVHQITGGFESLGIILGPAAMAVMMKMSVTKTRPENQIAAGAAGLGLGTTIVTTPELAAKINAPNVVSSTDVAVVTK